jgi:choline dehydrogenase-like flavoprotein
MDASPVPLDPGVTVRPGQVVGLGWFCRKELSPDNRVWFDDGTLDEHGLPAIRIDYELSAADHTAIAAAIDEVRCAALALGRPLDEPFLMPAGSSLHYLGTTRMGCANDGTSVCDPTGRVWDTDNLYVGGNNVIPTATACNPTLTAVALGVITAHAVRERLYERSTTHGNG